MEQSCTSLTALLHKLNPGVDIEEALKTVSRSNGERNGLIERFGGVDPNGEIPPSPGSFEWNETPLASSSRTQKEPPDGMASLPTEGAESGYLGE